MEAIEFYNYNNAGDVNIPQSVVDKAKTRWYYIGKLVERGERMRI